MQLCAVWTRMYVDLAAFAQGGLVCPCPSHMATAPRMGFFLCVALRVF